MVLDSVCASDERQQRDASSKNPLRETVNVAISLPDLSGLIETTS
jgi:hypothetical protein